MTETKRNVGLDLLRMLSMFMIVNLHVLGQGGVMVRVSGRESVYYACWLLETCAYCAVDCYGLISGYVGQSSRFRPVRLLELWLQVFFYSTGITLLYRFFAPGLLLEDSLWKAILPVCFKTYWYFSAYFGVFLLGPYLNKMLQALSEKEAKRLLLLLFCLFSAATAWPKVMGSDFLQLSGGYSFIWLAILYLMGGCLRKCSFVRWKKRWYLLLYSGCVVFSWLFKILVENYTREVYGEPKFGRLFTSYTAPTILVCALCLFLVFEAMEIRKPWLLDVIRFFSPLAFSVYLIHTHPLLWQYVMKNRFTRYRQFPYPVTILFVLGTSLVIYLACSLIDFGRKCLFDLWKKRRKG